MVEGQTAYRRQETRVPGSGLDHLTFKMGIFHFIGLEVGPGLDGLLWKKKIQCSCLFKPQWVSGNGDC